MRRTEEMEKRKQLENEIMLLEILMKSGSIGLCEGTMKIKKIKKEIEATRHNNTEI